MTKILIVAVLLGLLLFYALAGRAWLKTKPWAAGFFAAIEPFEIALYKKSETILWARLKMLVGVTLAVMTTAGQIDLTPLMPFVPEEYRGMARDVFNLMPLLITLVGMADEKLRNATTKPIQVVALADKDVTPQVATALMAADIAKENAVEVITSAKAA